MGRDKLALNFLGLKLDWADLLFFRAGLTWFEIFLQDSRVWTV